MWYCIVAPLLDHPECIANAQGQCIGSRRKLPRSRANEKRTMCTASRTPDSCSRAVIATNSMNAARSKLGIQRIVICAQQVNCIQNLYVNRLPSTIVYDRHIIKRHPQTPLTVPESPQLHLPLSPAAAHKRPWLSLQAQA